MRTGFVQDIYLPLCVITLFDAGVVPTGGNTSSTIGGSSSTEIYSTSTRNDNTKNENYNTKTFLTIGTSSLSSTTTTQSPATNAATLSTTSTRQFTNTATTTQSTATAARTQFTNTVTTTQSQPTVTPQFTTTTTQPTATTLQRKTTKKGVMESCSVSSQCVENAVCGDEQTCVCTFGFMASTDRTSCEPDDQSSEIIAGCVVSGVLIISCVSVLTYVIIRKRREKDATGQPGDKNVYGEMNPETAGDVTTYQELDMITSG